MNKIIFFSYIFYVSRRTSQSHWNGSFAPVLLLKPLILLVRVGKYFHNFI